MAAMNTVRVNKKGAQRARNGHLWIYRSDLVDVDAAAGVVSVKDERGNFIGQALYSAASQIALRFLTLGSEEIDRDWWQRRIREAVARRDVSADTNAYRLIYSEGDLLPSLIVDRYNDVLVMQTLSQGTEAFKSLFAEILIEELQPRAVIERTIARNIPPSDSIFSIYSRAPASTSSVNCSIAYDPASGSAMSATPDS